MSEKLIQDDLENLIDIWRMGCRSDVKEEYSDCKECPSKKVCKQAYNQIKEIVEKDFTFSKAIKQMEELFKQFKKKPTVTRTEIGNIARANKMRSMDDGVFYIKQLFESKGFEIIEK